MVNLTGFIIILFDAVAKFPHIKFHSKYIGMYFFWVYVSIRSCNIDVHLVLPHGCRSLEGWQLLSWCSQQS